MDNRDWEVVIGLEVHAQIISKTKLFSHAPNSFGCEPNTCVDLLDAGMPGSLPVLNRVCVDQAIKTGLAVNGQINHISMFDRKNYFYPDLPTGYQITQFYHPIVIGGHVFIDLEDQSRKKINIDHIHLEQDAGKSIHDIDPNATYIDLNRAGIGLMEIVTCPDMRSSDEAVSFMKKLTLLLRYINTSEANMERGNLRADANVSVHKFGTPFGKRVEIKNLNSFRFLKQAVDYEVGRQIEVLESGGVIVQETRLFNTKKIETVTMRSKEDAQDYRYFPEPDLPIIRLNEERIEKLRLTLPELPEEKKIRYIVEYGLTPYDADIITSDFDTVTYFEGCLENKNNTPDYPKMISNWMISELFALLNKENLSIRESRIKVSQLSKLIHLILSNIISGKIAKQVFSIMWDEEKDPELIVEEKDLRQIIDENLIAQGISDVLKQNPGQVEAYKSGKQQLFGFFVGQVLNHFKGKASPEIVTRLLKNQI